MKDEAVANYQCSACGRVHYDLPCVDAPFGCQECYEELEEILL